jgi:thiamine pyrophosphokinase
MIKSATLVLKECLFTVRGDCFGCESGALALINQNIECKAALGDFDSVDEKTKNIIQLKAKTFIQVPSQKDVSDSELAIDYLLNEGYQQIYVYGALGNRSDHHHVNLLLAYQHQELILVDENQSIQCYGAGLHTLKKEHYDLFSVFTFDEAVISLSGCAYPLDHRKIDVHNTLTLSNTWLDQESKLNVHQGKVLVIKTNNT